MGSVTSSRVALALALATAVALSLVATAVSEGSPAQASARLSSGYGQVGITLSFSTPTAYILRASPGNNATPCDNAKPIPGAAPVIIDDQGGRGKFIWPAELGPGLYSVCATPQTGTGQTAYSQQQFTVLDPNAPTPTAAPDPAAQVLLPSAGIAAGAPFDVTLSNWPSDIHVEAAWLVSQRKPVQGEMPPADESLSFTISPLQVPGGYTLQTQIPIDATAGGYAVRVTGFGVSILSNVFTVAAPSAPALLGSQRHVQSHPPSTAMLPTGLLEVLVAGLLLIVIGSLVHGAVRQRLARRPLAPQAGNERE
jgi:hypothetical protein